MVILGVLINETCYKTGRVSIRDFTVSYAATPLGSFFALVMAAALTLDFDV